jgi:hypothetical protein
MSSASCYTNKVRVTYAGNNTKVQYPGNVAKTNNIYYPALNCNPNFDTIVYFKGCRFYKNVECNPRRRPTEPTVYTGGDAETESTNILSGGNEDTESFNLLSGGNA